MYLTCGKQPYVPQPLFSEAQTVHPQTAPLFSPPCVLWWEADQAASRAAAWRKALPLCSDSIYAEGQAEPQVRGKEEVWKLLLTSLFPLPVAPLSLNTGSCIIWEHGQHASWFYKLLKIHHLPFTGCSMGSQSSSTFSILTAVVLNSSLNPHPDTARGSWTGQLLCSLFRKGSSIN